MGGAEFTYQSDVGTLQTVLLESPQQAFRNAERIAGQWRQLGYLRPPDLRAAVSEHQALATALRDFGVEVTYMPSRAEDGEGVGMDSLYVRDAALVSDQGAILCRMGKAARWGEPALLAEAFAGLGVPVHGRIEAPGTLEGGDVAWVDERTLAVGRGYRTNAAGIEQLQDLVAETVDEVLVVPLPHWKGPGDVFHLMSIYSPIAPDLALVYSPLMPVPFREALLGRGVELVEVPGEEFESLGCNCLAVGPRRCLLPKGNPQTRAALEAAGAEVREFSGREICLPGGGGPTCLTRPLLRSMDLGGAG